MILFDGICLGCFCQHDDGTVAVFAYQYDIRTIDDHLLLIASFLDKNLKRLVAQFRSLLNGGLNLPAWFYDDVKIREIDVWTPEHLYRTVLVGSLCCQADGNLVLRVMLGCPSLILSEQVAWTVRIPCVTIASLTPYLIQATTWYTVTVTDEGFAPFQVVVACP